MSETRKWYTEPESFVAIAALIVSVSALGVGSTRRDSSGQHDRAEVWPHVEIGLFVDDSGAKLKVENTGLGPGVVESIEVRIDGKAQHNWRGILQDLVGDSPDRIPTTRSTSMASGPGIMSRCSVCRGSRCRRPSGNR